MSTHRIIDLDDGTVRVIVTRDGARAYSVADTIDMLVKGAWTGGRAW